MRLSDDERQFLAAARAKAKHAWDPDRGTLRDHLASSHKKAMVDLLRRRQREKKRARRTETIDDAVPEPSVPDFFDRLAIIDQVSTLLARLTPTDRELVAMAHITRHSRDEIAALKGLSAAAVSSRLKRAMRRLRSRNFA